MYCEGGGGMVRGREGGIERVNESKRDRGRDSEREGGREREVGESFKVEEFVLYYIIMK